TPHTPRKTKGLLAAPFVFPRGTRAGWFPSTLKTGLGGSKRGSLIALLRFARTSLSSTIGWLERTAVINFLKNYTN
ncbi:MAG: hypothetical protein NTW61_00335, partial [Candidatus Melainabacteria bacterium]|nr:hypothetical protein [Candidatus Melainabacteria bacterium]